MNPHHQEMEWVVFGTVRCIIISGAGIFILAVAGFRAAPLTPALVLFLGATANSLKKKQQQLRADQDLLADRWTDHAIHRSILIVLPYPPIYLASPERSPVALCFSSDAGVRV